MPAFDVISLKRAGSMYPQAEEPSRKIVFILGDIHGDMAALNWFINRQIRQSRHIRELASKCAVEAVILQCGDFAFFWPGEDNSEAIKNSVDFLRDGIVKIYWCGGNHEDWNVLDGLFPGGSAEAAANMKEVARGVWFARFGAVLELMPNLRVLFAGGAESHDMEGRVEGESWWRQEGISQEDMARLADIPGVDWVVSHTAPYYLDVGAEWQKRREPSRRELDAVFDKFRPQKWFFGHFHHYCHGTWEGCQWQGLNYLGGSGKSWERLCL